MTHGGNTVRLVQAQGKIPIAIARQLAHGEMNNNHQVEYLAKERRHGRVVVVDDVRTLDAAVEQHPAVERRLLRERPTPSVADPQFVADRLDVLCASLVKRPRR